MNFVVAVICFLFQSPCLRNCILSLHVSLCVCICVCCMNVCIFMCVGTYVHREDTGVFLVSSLMAFFFYLLRQNLTLSLEFDASVTLVKPDSLHFLPLQQWVIGSTTSTQLIGVCEGSEFWSWCWHMVNALSIGSSFWLSAFHFK